MKKIKQAILLTLCAALLVCASVMGTMAYLQATSGPATNTMKVGRIEITLDEAKVDEYGVKDGDTRVTENAYKLIPGRTYTKDPIVHIGDDSENCFIFVRVENGIKDIEAGGDTTIEKQMADIGWTLVNGESNVYYYNQVVGENMDIPVFYSFKISSSANGEDLKAYEGRTIQITAYAVQTDGFENAVQAWNATFGANTGD